MNETMMRVCYVAVLVISSMAVVSAQAGSLEPPPGPVSSTRPPDTCFDNTGNRFVDCGDGTIKDTVEGLYWLKDARCPQLGLQPWANANKAAAVLAHGQCGLTDGSLPGDWRLPTLACPSGSACSLATPPTGEFATIFAASCTAPFILDTAGTGCWSEGNPFSGVQSSFYWSATTWAALPDGAWYAYLASALAGADPKIRDHYVWPVRGGP